MPSVVEQESSKKPLRIIIAVPNLASTGGIQRFAAGLANDLNRQGHTVICFAPSPKGTTPRFEYDEAVQFAQFENIGLKEKTLALQKELIKYNPDVVIVPESTPNALIWVAALIGTNIPLLYSEHTDPMIIMNERWSKSERESVLWCADKIHLLMPNFIPSIPESLQYKTRVIYNPLSLSPSHNTTTSKTGYTLLSLGRLSKVKQIRLLIAAFTLLTQEFPQWKLDIWGKGSDEKNLHKQIKKLPQEIQQRVRLCGLSTQPIEQYSTADIFCIPSRFEGCPLTVTEAMSQDLPIVGFAGCNGVNYLVHHEKNGLLAPEMTAESLACELRRLMQDAELRQRLGQQGKKDTQSFTPKHLYPQWEELIYQTASCKGHTSLSRINDDNIPEEERLYQAIMHRLLERPNITREFWLRRRTHKWLRRHPSYTNIVNKLLRKLGLAIID